MPSSVSDLALFARRLLLRPKQVSAIAPSSRALARAMADGLGPATGAVVEFGPGTGRLTEAILDAGVAPADLTLFELDPAFARHLRTRFPGVRVEECGAERARERVAGQAGAVISGLPLLSMPDPVRTAIAEAAAALIAPSGVYVQFTYGPDSPLSPAMLSTLGLRAERGRKVWTNLPPARVWRYRPAPPRPGN
jgi:phosphatidylethanolamine/phosphatidyl-N-methylethanolamine N-methyltransferase